MAFVRHVVEAREERKHKAADTLEKICKIFDERCKVTVEAHVAEWGDLRERVASLTSYLESMSLELQSMPRLIAEAARLQMQLFEPRKENESRSAKLVLLKEVKDEITAKKKKSDKVTVVCHKLVSLLSPKGYRNSLAEGGDGTAEGAKENLGSQLAVVGEGGGQFEDGKRLSSVVSWKCR